MDTLGARLVSRSHTYPSGSGGLPTPTLNLVYIARFQTLEPSAPGPEFRNPNTEACPESRPVPIGIKPFDFLRDGRVQNVSDTFKNK